MVLLPLPSNDGSADAHELVRMIRREADSFEPAVFSFQQNMAAQITIIQFNAPDKSPASAKNGRTDLDFQDSPCGNDHGVKEKPRLQLQPVGINPVFLPQACRRAARNKNWRLKSAQDGLSVSTPLVSFSF